MALLLEAHPDWGLGPVSNLLKRTGNMDERHKYGRHIVGG